MIKLKQSGHGGNCCGISHIYNFGVNASEDQKRLLDRLLACSSERFGDEDPEEHWWDGESLIIEAVLSQRQTKAWEPILLSKGFKVVNSFFNPNSHNECTIYHYNDFGV